MTTNGITHGMTTKPQWDKMKYFFSTPLKYPGLHQEIDRFDDYENASSNVERLGILFRLPVVQEMFRNQEADADLKVGRVADGGKSENDSKRWRELGNQSFKAGNDRKALQMYNEAVIYAPQHKHIQSNEKENETNGNAKTEVKDPSSNNYVLALANRSAAHVRLNQWEHAETDLSVILGNLDEYRKYKEVGDTYNLYPFGPHTTPAKLWDRRYNSLLALQRYDDAKDCLSICIDMLKDQNQLDRKNGNKESQHVKIQELEKCLQKWSSPSLNGKHSEPSAKTSYESKRSKSFVAQLKYPGLSNAIDIKNEPDRGRFGLANRDIDVGEVLLMEDPVAAKIKLKETKNHCGNCLRECWGTQVACSECVVERFCSNECLHTALRSYHSFDCGGGTVEKGVASHSFASFDKMLTDLQGETGAVGFYKLCYRLVAQKPLSYFKKHFSWILDSNNEAKDIGNDIFTPGSYESLYTLVRHDQNDTCYNIFWVLVSNCFHLRTLQLSGYFDASSLDDETNDFASIKDQKHLKSRRRPAKAKFTEDEKLISGVLIYTFQLLRYNMHAILEQERPSNSPYDWNKWNTHSIGTAIYPTLALLNHSCDPNITKYFDGKTVIVLAGKRISKGEEVTENYFPYYPFISTEDRTKWLSKHYKFDCKCVACEGDYPLKADIPTSLELELSSYGKDIGIKTTEELTNKLAEIANSIVASKGKLLELKIPSNNETENEETVLEEAYEDLVMAYSKVCGLISKLPHRLIFDNYEWHNLLLRRTHGNRMLTWN